MVLPVMGSPLRDVSAKRGSSGMLNEVPPQNIRRCVILRYCWTLVAILLTAASCPPEPDCVLGAPPQTWSVTRQDDVLEIAYGRDGLFPQYAALHLGSSYFRLNYGPQSAWGTSVVLLPSFWSGGQLHQGAPVDARWTPDREQLVIELESTILGLQVQAEVRLSPPVGDSLSAAVTVHTTGDVTLDDRPGEAFKLVMLSSMRVAADTWDVQSAYVGSQTFTVPPSGWIVQPPVIGTRFGLVGGTSSWKTNAPTIGVVLDEPREITGWVTPSNDPNDDNAGFWAAAAEVVREWRYGITARR